MKSLTRIVALGIAVAAISLTVAAPASAKNFPAPHENFGARNIAEIAYYNNNGVMEAFQQYRDTLEGGESDILTSALNERPYCGKTYRIDMYFNLATFNAAVRARTVLPPVSQTVIFKAKKCGKR